jgi:hypothetical protein
MYELNVLLFSVLMFTFQEHSLPIMARRSLILHEDVDWDPMSADYYDPSFNNYTQCLDSRLDRQFQPFHPRYMVQAFCCHTIVY